MVYGPLGNDILSTTLSACTKGMHFNWYVTFVTTDHPEDDAMRHRNMYEFFKRQLSIEYIVRWLVMYCKKSEIWLLYTIDTSYRKKIYS